MTRLLNCSLLPCNSGSFFPIRGFADNNLSASLIFNLKFLAAFFPHTWLPYLKISNRLCRPNLSHFILAMAFL